MGGKKDTLWPMHIFTTRIKTKTNVCFRMTTKNVCILYPNNVKYCILQKLERECRRKVGRSVYTWVALSLIAGIHGLLFKGDKSSNRIVSKFSSTELILK